MISLRAGRFAILVFLPAIAAADLTMPAGFPDSYVLPSLVSNNLPKNSANNPYLDLRLAVTGPWTTPDPDNKGVYDPDQWAVVYKLVSANINHNTNNVLFCINHPSGAPVIWLVEGNVTIGAPIALDGDPGQSSGFQAVPGPGGFAGSTPSSGGLGPGGAGAATVSGGSYRTAGEGTKPGSTYGNAMIFPLIGGSGGSAKQGTPYSGGAGGGALLIFAKGTITLNSTVSAYGGAGGWTSGGGAQTGGGSGGAIRLVADTITGSGHLRKGGGGGNSLDGGSGRVRIEAVTTNLAITSDYAQPVNGYSYASLSPGDSPKVFLGPTDSRIRAVKFTHPNGSEIPAPIPADPAGFLKLPTDVDLPGSGLHQLHVECQYVPVDWVVKARFVLISGTDFTVTIPFSSGNGTLSHWVGDVDVPGFISTVQVRADAP